MYHIILFIYGVSYIISYLPCVLDYEYYALYVIYRLYIYHIYNIIFQIYIYIYMSQLNHIPGNLFEMVGIVLKMYCAEFSFWCSMSAVFFAGRQI